MDVFDAVTRRQSVRAFTDEAVDREVLERVLAAATRAPSGGNLQPWHVAVLTGSARDGLVELVRRRLHEGEAPPTPEYPVYPRGLRSPYRERRFANGEQLYAVLDIPRKDRAARLGQFARNWEFFGAPVGLLLFVDRDMGAAQWSDLGAFLQSTMLLLQEEGLSSCAQEAWAVHHDLARRIVTVPERLMLFCGMAVGHADRAAPVNTWRSDRAPLSDVVTFLDQPGPLTTKEF